MPPKQKKLKPLENPQASDSDHEMNDESDGSAGGIESNMEIQVDFEACTINDDDFHGIRNLLQQVFLKSTVDVSALTELIIKQAEHLGSSIKVVDVGDEDSDIADSADQATSSDSMEEQSVLGVTTVVSLKYHKDNDCVKQVKEMLWSKCKARADADFILPKLTSVLSESVGLLIHERLLNIPVEIAPPIFDSLINELKEASQLRRKEFSCKYYILITRGNLIAAGPRKRKHEASAETESTCGKFVFDYPECEVLQKESLLSFDYPVGDESDKVLQDNAMEPCRTVMVLDASKFERAVSTLKLQ